MVRLLPAGDFKHFTSSGEDFLGILKPMHNTKFNFRYLDPGEDFLRVLAFDMGMATILGQQSGTILTNFCPRDKIWSMVTIGPGGIEKKLLWKCWLFPVYSSCSPGTFGSEELKLLLKTVARFSFTSIIICHHYLNVALSVVTLHHNNRTVSRDHY